MKHIKQIALLAVALMMIVAQFAISTSAEDTVLVNLMPTKDNTMGKLQLTGCTMEENSDGSVTFTLTATSANVKMIFAENVYQEESGGTIYSGDAFDITKGAFVVYDYASADGVSFSRFVAHYTRKDKATANTLADLYLNSMESDSTYAKHRKVSGEGFGVWDLGTYVTVDKGSSCVFDNHMHRFCDLDFDMVGKVGGKLTIYKFYVSSTADVKDLGKVRPEPTKFESSAASSAASSVATSSAASSAASSDTSSAKSEASSTSSEAKSDVTSSKSDSSASSVSTETEDSSNWWIYVVIAAVVVAVVAVVIYFVSKNKKKE
ncbi:MAG TPA: hypothetical protein PLD48_04720 [Bacillota bacterium]|nr:hypothetical protein [Bacillota bacterium]HPP85472.1 hypothetical protein [Bacillota bacterium]